MLSGGPDAQKTEAKVAETKPGTDGIRLLPPDPPEGAPSAAPAANPPQRPPILKQPPPDDSTETPQRPPILKRPPPDDAGARKP